MAPHRHSGLARQGDILVVIHDFAARTDDELTLKRGERIELIERDDDFGDGWFLGKQVQSGRSGLFPEVYTAPAVKMAATNVSRHFGLSKQNSMNHSTPPMSPDDALPDNQNGHNASFDGNGDDEQHSAEKSNLSMGSFSRRLPASTQRSLSLNSIGHQNSTVMNETLSVIEEHITDMHTPRQSFLASDSSVHDDDYIRHSAHRRSYINGHETDEEDAVQYTEKEVRSWNPNQVAEQLQELGAEGPQCEVFKQQEITGDVLLEMDRETILLKEFELGTLGRRLALFKKIQRFQNEVKGSRPASKAETHRTASMTSYRENREGTRERSASGGTVLPKIPSLMDNGSSSYNYRNHTVQRSQSSARREESPSQQEPDAAAGHSPPHSAASIRGIQHSRRHSSIDANLATILPQTTPDASSSSSHAKKGSLDRSWTMSDIQPPNTADSQVSSGQDASPTAESTYLSPATPEYGISTANPADLDRGYFSGNEVENRRFRNVLRKRESPTHSRAPSDGYKPHRLSGVFNHKRSGSTDSVNETASLQSPSFYSSLKGMSRAFSGPGARHLSPKFPNSGRSDYGSVPSIDEITTSPNIPGSDTSSIDRSSASPAIPSNMNSSKPRTTGLRAISDAVTGNEKKRAQLPQDAGPTDLGKDSFQSPSRTDSSNPSIASKSISFEERKHGTMSAGPTAKYVSFPGGNQAARRKSKQETSAYTRGLEKKPPEVQIAGSDYSGWMKKKSKKLGKWHPRLFVLRGRRLSYYYSEDDTEEKGLIDISFHRVLPANKDLITGLHATITGVGSSPTSPQNSLLQTAAQADGPGPEGSGTFIFKLVPPRPGLSKAVNFTQPKVHFFAVNSLQEGRNWMAALMKATIERDELKDVTTTYKEKTISLMKAKEMRVRPKEFLTNDGDAEGLGIKELDESSKAAEEGDSTGDNESKKDSMVEIIMGPDGIPIGIST